MLLLVPVELAVSDLLLNWGWDFHYPLCNLWMPLRHVHLCFTIPQLSKLHPPLLEIRICYPFLAFSLSFSPLTCIGFDLVCFSELYWLVSFCPTATKRHVLPQAMPLNTHWMVPWPPLAFLSEHTGTALSGLKVPWLHLILVLIHI